MSKQKHHLQKNQAQNKSDNKQKKTLLQRIVYLTNFFMGLIITIYFVKKICTDQYQPIFLYYAALPHQILQSVGIFIAVLLLMYTLSADWLDILGKTENDLYRSHKNVISNTIQWSIVFLGALLYYKTINENDANRRLQIAVTDLFLLGRLIFSIGYTIGTLIGYQSFRGIGFRLSLGAILIIFGEITGYSIVNYLK